MTIDSNTIVTLHKKGHINSSIARTYSPGNGLQGGKKVQLDRENMQSTRSGQKTIRIKIERRTCDENRTWFPKKSCVPHAKLSRVDWRLLLKTREEKLNKCCSYLLSIIVAISISKKFLNCFFFIENYYKMCVAIIMVDLVLQMMQ